MLLKDIPRHEKSVSISKISRTTCRIIARRISPEGEVLCEAPASGFFWRKDNRVFLVSNRHVFSGVNGFTGEIMGFIPNAALVNVFVERCADHGRFEMLSMSGTVELLDRYEKPLWHEHPADRKIDVAALEIKQDLESDFSFVCLNGTEIRESGPRFVGDDVFIIGFPEGNSFDRAMPLWKRGSLATEPSLNEMSLPQMYVDTIGNKGLSGSPVISRVDLGARPLSRDEDNEGMMYQFLGVYAGRLGGKGINSQIGRVFKRDAMEEVLEVAVSNSKSLSE